MAGGPYTVWDYPQWMVSLPGAINLASSHSVFPMHLRSRFTKQQNCYHVSVPVCVSVGVCVCVFPSGVDELITEITSSYFQFLDCDQETHPPPWRRTSRQRSCEASLRPTPPSPSTPQSQQTPTSSRSANPNSDEGKMEGMLLLNKVDQRLSASERRAWDKLASIVWGSRCAG